MFKRLLRSRKGIAFLVVLVGVIGFAGWKVVTGRTGQQNEFQTAQVTRGTIVSTVAASGQVLTTNIIDISTQASGVVKTVYVKDGDKVAAGQKIVAIELNREGQQNNASAWSSYLSAKNAVDSAKASLYTLQSQLFAANQKLINDAVARNLAVGDPTYIQQNADWLAAEAKYKNQQAAINQSKASLNNAWLSYQTTASIITAPVAGVVTNLGVVPGMVLSQTTSSQRVAVIQNETRPIISVNLSEIDVPKVKVDQKVTVGLDSLPDKTFTGKVATIDRIGTTSNNVTSYPSLIQLDTASAEILPNMAASTNIVIETKTDVLVVPSAAVQTQGGQSYVRVLRNGQEQQAAVEVGIADDTQIEITSGLSEGDQVVTGTITTQTQTGGSSVFSSGGFGGGAFRTGGFGGTQRR